MQPYHGYPPGQGHAGAIVAAGGLQLYGDPVYVARRNFFNFLGIRCRILRLDGSLLYYAHMKAFKLKEDITVYADEGKTTPLLSIKARQILDISAAYDVVDVTGGFKVGALKRKGLASFVRDEWHILDGYDRPIACIREDSMALALIRRLLSNLIPQSYTVSIGLSENAIGYIKGTWNPFLVKYTCDFSHGAQGQLDHRLLLAGVVLLMCIEGRQG